MDTLPESDPEVVEALRQFADGLATARHGVPAVVVSYDEVEQMHSIDTLEPWMADYLERALSVKTTGHDDALITSVPRQHGVQRPGIAEQLIAARDAVIKQRHADYEQAAARSRVESELSRRAIDDADSTDPMGLAMASVLRFSADPTTAAHYEQVYRRLRRISLVKIHPETIARCAALTVRWPR